MAGDRAVEREALRAEWAARVPRWYSPFAHLAFTSVVGLGLAALAVASIRTLRLWELAAVPAIWVFANAVEWRAHRDLLHRETAWAKPLFIQHTLQHHRIYWMDDMSIRSRRELRMVLIPAFGIVLIALITLPMAALLWGAGEHNLAALWTATTMGYVVSYEWLHLSYHLPRDGFIGRRALIRRLARHHAIHHSPERMQRWNLNVTVPLWDFVRGTLWRGEVSQSMAAEPRPSQP
ncbi:MAG: sterol desaturase family protein [Deltaproteobacteria bacterium]